MLSAFVLAVGVVALAAAQAESFPTSGYTIYTVAGTGIQCNPTTDPCGDGGKAIDANLRAPSDVAFDSAGNLYIADSNNNRIRKVTPTGVISTFAGRGVFCPPSPPPGGDTARRPPATLNLPYGIAFDSSGNLFV